MSETSGRRGSVRWRLLAIALLPMLVVVPLLLGITMLRWSEKFDRMLLTKVSSDLTVAGQYLGRIRDITGERVEALAQSVRFRDWAEGGGVAGFLETERAAMGLDFLIVIGADGALVAASPPDVQGVPDLPVIADAAAGAAGTAVEILQPGAIAALSPALAERARLPIVPTRNASPSDRTVEDRGMFITAAAPGDAAGTVVAGGLLLNQNLGFIDTINDLVYREGSLPEGSLGTATLFLDDVRISTNVRLFEGARALGTRVSAAVRARVLDRGEVWRDSAFVVNDWYVSAYEPITDSHGVRVGMLYVGFLEAPFTRSKRLTILLVMAAFVGVAALTVPLFLRWAQGIFQPLEAMTATIARVEAGDMEARTNAGPGTDEIARVAAHLDQLLQRLQAREAELRALNEDLNDRVRARTADLQRANLALEAATKQLVLSEKLAAIGEITAGVAHEINNPVAVIIGNLEVLREALGPEAAEFETELTLVETQARRISEMVTRLLQFARPEEFAGGAERTDPAQVAKDVRPLVQHLLTDSRIALTMAAETGRQVLMNASELQQVLVNLLINAIHAMPEGGEAQVTVRDADRAGRRGVEILVADTGIGMDEATQDRIFDPFFTTRRKVGTGLGLSICQTLVARQGGTITVTSAPGQGSTFTLWLPEAD
jgi:signal transduction histidine kinase